MYCLQNIRQFSKTGRKIWREVALLRLVEVAEAAVMGGGCVCVCGGGRRASLSLNGKVVFCVHLFTFELLTFLYCLPILLVTADGNVGKGLCLDS